MKKSELSFKCVLPTPKHANTITERLEAIGVYNVEVVKSRFAESGKTAKFLSLDNKMGFVFGLSDNAYFFCNWTEPLMSYEDALKLIESIEPDAPEFDIKPSDKIICRVVSNSMKPSFSINTYDCDGDLIKKCLTIHIDRFAMDFQHQVELDEFIKNLQKISDEIAANYEQW